MRRSASLIENAKFVSARHRDHYASRVRYRDDDNANATSLHAVECFLQKLQIGRVTVFLATALDPFFLERVLGGTIALVGGDLSRLDVLKLRLIGEDLRLQLFGIDRNHFPARADRVPDKSSLENVRINNLFQRNGWTRLGIVAQ